MDPSVEFVVVDVETTGLDPKNERVVEFAAWHFNSAGQLGWFSQLCNPGKPISSTLTAIHGIDDAMVAKAPQTGEALVRFLYWLAERRHAILMAHNAPFDTRFILAEAAREEIYWAPPAMLDTLEFAKRRVKLKSYKLTSIRDHYRIPPGQQHNALYDCRCLAKAFLHMLREAPTISDFEGLRRAFPALQDLGQPRLAESRQ